MNKTHTVSQERSISIENKLHQLTSSQRHSLRKPASAPSITAEVETPEKDALGIRGDVSPASFYKGMQNSEVSELEF